MRAWIISMILIMLISLLSRPCGVRGPWFALFRVFAVLYIDLFRGIPAVLLMLLRLGIPPSSSPAFRTPLFWGTVALVVSYVATPPRSTARDRCGARLPAAAAKALGLTQ